MSKGNDVRPSVIEQSRTTPVIGEFEVVVLGGGPAGIAAAVAAGRSGRSTLLVERNGFVGGALTAAGLSTFCGLHACVNSQFRQVVHGIADELQSGLERLDALNPPHLSLGKVMAQAFDIAAFKCVADELLQLSGTKLLFHAMAVGALMNRESELGALLVESKSGRGAIVGRVFIDCSGDADLAFWAGAPFEKTDQAGGMFYPSSLCRIAGVDPDKAGPAWETANQLMAGAEGGGRWQFPRKNIVLRPQKHPTEWRMNATNVKRPDGGPVDGTDVEQLTYGEIEGRKQIQYVFDFIRKNVPGFERAYIVDIASELGIRETRRIIGPYQLGIGDVMECADFPDAIGVNGWPVEAHESGKMVVKFPNHPRGYHQLPFRMILPQKIDNLYVAGRCASMTHEGQSSARVSGPCFVMGQAAGTAADLALQSHVACRNVDISALQKRLAADGVYLGLDVARGAQTG